MGGGGGALKVQVFGAHTRTVPARHMVRGLTEVKRIESVERKDIQGSTHS